MDCNGINYRAIVIGASAGGLTALTAILQSLKSTFCLPILVVQHVSPQGESYLATHFETRCILSVKEAEDKEPIKRGSLYIAPPNYHMLVEFDGCIALSIDPPVNFSRPSIDVLFESAADFYGKELIGIVLTGANSDGAAGLKYLSERGGMTIVQSIETAAAEAMPKAAIEALKVDHILDLKEIGGFLNDICEC
ncbi:MAG: chemotaxis protein CheB [Psychromonas sp.]|nr:chemotaxis protein CheB [Psychromonas sp.]